MLFLYNVYAAIIGSIIALPEKNVHPEILDLHIFTQFLTKITHDHQKWSWVPLGIF